MNLPAFEPDDTVPTDSAGDTASGCEGCAGRRAFLHDVVAATVAAAGLSVLGPLREIEAMEARVGRGAVRYPIPTTDGVSIDRKNDAILARVGDKVIAFSLACPHQNTTLRALPGTAGFQCPKHKSRYQPDGTFISGRATRNMDRLPISRDGDTVVVDPDVAYRSDKEPTKWAAAMVTL